MLGRYLAAAAAAVLLLVTSAHAQDFPKRPITMIVPFTAGGTSDVIARAVADQMSAALGQSIIIENVGGAGGSTALTRAVRGARERGAIVIVVAHRPIGIEGVDQLLVLKDGRMQTFGPKETVLAQVLQRAAPPVPTPIKIVADAGAAKS